MSEREETRGRVPRDQSQHRPEGDNSSHALCAWMLLKLNILGRGRGGGNYSKTIYATGKKRF